MDLMAIRRPPSAICTNETRQRRTQTARTAADKSLDCGAVRTALNDMLEKNPGEALTPPVRDACIACYATIVPDMHTVEQTETVKT